MVVWRRAAKWRCWTSILQWKDCRTLIIWESTESRWKSYRPETPPDHHNNNQLLLFFHTVQFSKALAVLLPSLYELLYDIFLQYGPAQKPYTAWLQWKDCRTLIIWESTESRWKSYRKSSGMSWILRMSKSEMTFIQGTIYSSYSPQSPSSLFCLLFPVSATGRIYPAIP